MWSSGVSAVRKRRRSADSASRGCYSRPSREGRASWPIGAWVGGRCWSLPSPPAASTRLWLAVAVAELSRQFWVPRGSTRRCSFPGSRTSRESTCSHADSPPSRRAPPSLWSSSKQSFLRVPHGAGPSLMSGWWSRRRGDVAEVKFVQQLIA